MTQSEIALAAAEAGANVVDERYRMTISIDT
jgi:hypothetical protein